MNNNRTMDWNSLYSDDKKDPVKKMDPVNSKSFVPSKMPQYQDDAIISMTGPTQNGMDGFADRRPANSLAKTTS